MNHLQLEGSLDVDGETVKWERRPELWIELPEGDRLYIGGDPDVHTFRLAMRVFRIGYRMGHAMGRSHLGLEIRKLIGAE